MKYAIGIDLGGTAIKFGVINELGEVLFQGKVPTNARISVQSVVKQLLIAADTCVTYARSKKIELIGIGLGTPGIVDSTYRRVIGGAENIAGWENYSLADEMEKFLEMPVWINNDANLMGLGEQTFGAARGCSDVIFITVGTGIGGAIIIDGKLFGGYQGRGVELGHTPIIANGIDCACGSRGCLEAYASTSALISRFELLCIQHDEVIHDKVDGKYIVSLYNSNNPIAIMAINEHCDLLGHGIAGFINIFSPQRVIIGGGISESGEFYIKKIQKAAYQYAIPDCAVNTIICSAKLGNKAGLIGAAEWAFINSEKK